MQFYINSACTMKVKMIIIVQEIISSNKENEKNV